jgi:DNA-binding IscR family transcriptional regulator
MDPSEITMDAVMTHLGGYQSPLVGCLDDAGNCDQSPSCGQRSVWREVENAIKTVLDNTSIADLADRMSKHDARQAIALPRSA